MEQYIIKGGNPLVGEVEIGGAKNAALAILAAAIMTDEPVLIENLPDVNDINVMLDASMIILRRSAHLTICWEHCWENTTRPKWRFRADAISGAVPLTSI